jgi:glucan phosphorylase
LARSRLNFDDHAAFQATALSLRDRLIEMWNDTQQYYIDKKVKRVYYFSIEYLLGRALCNTLTNLDLKSQYAQVMQHKREYHKRTQHPTITKFKKKLLCLFFHVNKKKILMNRYFVIGSLQPRI